MPDFPSGFTLGSKTVIHTFGPESLIGQYIVAGGVQTAGGGTNPASNRAWYVPVIVEAGAYAQKMGIQITAQAGNVDVGIYNEGRQRLVSAGTTAAGAAGLQVFDITDTWLDPGLYYLAYSCSTGTTLAIQRLAVVTAITRVCGVAQQDTAFPLPATATFAAASSSFTPWIAVQLGATL